MSPECPVMISIVRKGLYRSSGLQNNVHIRFCRRIRLLLRTASHKQHTEPFFEVLRIQQDIAIIILVILNDQTPRENTCPCK